MKCISKYLVQCVPVKPGSSHATGARILTIEECVQIIQKKEKRIERNKEGSKKKKKEEAARIKNKQNLLKKEMKGC